MRCMDCNNEFIGDSGPPPDRRCPACQLIIMTKFRKLPQEEQDRRIAEGLMLSAKEKGGTQNSEPGTEEE